MTVRTSKKTVTFRRAFVIDGFDGVLPAGVYRLESEQDILDGQFLPNSLRGSVLIHLHAELGSPALAQTLTVPWDVLEMALSRDQLPAEMPADAAAAQRTPERTTDSRPDEADRQALDRAEDEGMILRPR